MGLSKEVFQGCMVGAVIGDCLGSPFECLHWNGIRASRVRSHFTSFKSSSSTFKYTDDTAMTFALAQSLCTDVKVDPKNISESFTSRYFQEPWRGYGAHVKDVFVKLQQREKSRDLTLPAQEQFAGSGSYGNGAAMRVHPLSLFHARDSIIILENSINSVSRLTHAHENGVNGALFQASVVRSLLLDSNPYDDLTRIFSSSTSDYGSQLVFLKDSLREKSKEFRKLGNDVSALHSVPSALYSYMSSLSTYSSSEFTDVSNPFTRTLMTAMSFGGDTDTIMSMAGAIAGAAFGINSIPKDLMESCEGVSEAMLFADQLFALSLN